MSEETTDADSVVNDPLDDVAQVALGLIACYENVKSELAKLTFVFGEIPVVTKLRATAGTLKSYADILKRAVNEATANYVAAASQNSLNVVNAAIAGAKVAIAVHEKEGAD